MPLKKLVGLFSNKKSQNKLNIGLTCSNNAHLKSIVDEIATELSALSPENSDLMLSLEFNPSEKLILQFDQTNFADGFTESITRNIGKIWQQEFEVDERWQHKNPDHPAARINLPPELYSRAQWFVYLFLDGLVDKKIGRRWIK